jgi:hypothetical protein
VGDLRARIAAIISRELPGVSFALPLADILVRELGLRQEQVEDWHGKATFREQN